MCVCVCVCVCVVCVCVCVCVCLYVCAPQSQLITSKGYPCKEYTVVTPDHYILGLQRIPYGKRNSKFVHTEHHQPWIVLALNLFTCLLICLFMMSGTDYGTLFINIALCL